MNPSTSTTEPAFPRRIVPVFLALGFTALGTAFLQMGFFFYATDRWGWSPRKNLGLAAVEGVAYICGALCSSKLAGHVGRKALTSALPISFAAVAVVCAIYCDRPRVVTPMLVGLYFLVAAYWPALESLAATGADAAGMSRRLAVYNLIWPAIAAGGTAVCGLVIAHLPIGFFYISAIINALAAVTIAVGGKQPEEERSRNANENVTSCEETRHGEPAAEPELLRQRTLALWLSRIALPSTYLVSYALAALMPTLPSLAGLSVSSKTVIGSMWLVGRWIGFSILALSAFWHTRPRLLIAASAAMLLAFVMICVPISMFTGARAGGGTDLWVMGAAQMVLGFALALIYSASLYFGMVLSEGSTEHGGYHEALIGLGQVLGPGLAAAAQVVRPGSIFPAVGAVSALLIVSLIASEYAAMRVGRPR